MHNYILFEEKNQIGKITLNRSPALNALNHAMFVALYQKLTSWKNNSAIKLILIRSNSEKAFCAGGDIRAIYENKHQSMDVVNGYFRLEYEIDRMIFHYHKPTVALMHGITMGGGVGISLYASHCVAADNLRWAMPETTIGFFPYVGATYYLSRFPDFIGVYLALTGNAIDAETALHLNLIKKIIAYDQFDAVEQALMNADGDIENHTVVSVILEKFSKKIADQKNYLPNEKIKKYFQYNTVERIIDTLQEDKCDWAQETVSTLLRRSPTSLKVTLKQLQWAKEKTFDEVIAMDNKIARVMLQRHDFFEGVRAAIIDKDKKPRWEPNKLAEVSDKEVDLYFN